MNAFLNFLSSPLKQPAEGPPPSSMPLTTSRSRTYSPKERQRLNKYAMDRIANPEGRSPRSRLSNVSSAPSAHDTTGDITIISRSRRSTITMPPPSDKKRAIDSSSQASPTPKLNTADVLRDVTELVASRRQSTRDEGSPELGSPPPSSYNTSPAVMGSSKTTRKGWGMKATPRSSLSSRANTTPAKNIDQSPAAEDDEQQEEERDRPVDEYEFQEHDEDEDKEEDAEDDEKYVFKRIMDHRWDGDKIELRVEWQDGERTWTPEEIFHEDNLRALLAYWRTVRGGRPENPHDPDVFQVFAIRKHRTHQGQNQVYVEWVGYDKNHCTWESQDDMESAAQEHVDAYFEKIEDKMNTQRTSKGASKAAAKKGTAKKVNTKGKGTTKDPLTKTRGRSRVTKS
ncbi:hypothetical protein FGRMN_1752 [Fusarium graminum]|nr:hypothetical protein FGRMN_1752 [Fusarium graminum]